MLHWPLPQGEVGQGETFMQRERAERSDISINMKFLHRDVGKTPLREFTLRIPLLCVLGLSFYLGWIFCLFWSPSLLPPSTFGDFGAHIVRTAMTVAMFVAYVVFGVFARFFASRRGETALRVVALVCCPFAGAVGLLPVNTDVAWGIFLWCASGVGSSALLLVWSKKLVVLNRKQIIFSASSAFLVGSLLYAATAFMPSGIAYTATVSLPIASVVLAWLALSPSVVFAQFDEEDTSGRTSEEGVGFQNDDVSSNIWDDLDESEVLAEGVEAGQRFSFMRTVLLAFAYSVGIGFVGASATVEVYYPFAVHVIVMANVIAAVFTVLFLVRKPRNIALILTEIFLPIMLIGIFVFSFADYVGQLLCLLVLFALLACHDIVDIASVSKSFRLFDENYVKTFAVGRTLNGLGCTLGWIVGTVMCFGFAGDALGRMFICFALVVFLVVATSFAVFHPGPLSYVREVRIDAERSARQAISGGIGETLKLKTSLVAQRYELTPRQTEVLCCLAQGRNAGYIADRFTISAHTAKSHIYNIYNKLGVHSQQELLDIVEAEECLFQEKNVPPDNRLV